MSQSLVSPHYVSQLWVSPNKLSIIPEHSSPPPVFLYSIDNISHQYWYKLGGSNWVPWKSPNIHDPMNQNISWHIQNYHWQNFHEANALHLKPGIVLCMHPANNRRCYNVTSSLIGCSHTHNDPCKTHISISLSTMMSWHGNAYWPFVRGFFHWWISLTKGQQCEAIMYLLFLSWTSC